MPTDIRIDPSAYIGPYNSIGDRYQIALAEVDELIVKDDAVIDVERKLARSTVGKAHSRGEHGSSTSVLSGTLFFSLSRFQQDASLNRPCQRSVAIQMRRLKCTVFSGIESVTEM